MKNKSIWLMIFFIYFTSSVFADLNTNLIAVYTMDSNCVDESISGYKLTSLCDYDSVNKKGGVGSCDCEETNGDYAYNSTIGVALRNGGSVSYWHRHEKISAYDGMVSIQDSSNSLGRLYYMWNSGNKIDHYIGDGVNGNNNLPATTYTDTTSFHHQVITWNSTGAITGDFYDNVSRGTAGAANVAINDWNALFINDVPTDGSPGDNIGDGWYDEIYVWTRQITIQEINELYAAGTGYFYSDFGICINSYENTTRTNITCLSSNLMNQSYVTYDVNNCGNYTNTTYYIAEYYCLYDSGTTSGTCDFTETNEKIDNLQGDFEMIGYVLLWLGLWIFGYYAFNTNNEFLGVIMICLTIPLDIYFSILFFQGGAPTKLLGIAFDIVAVVTLAVIPLLKRKVRTKA